MSKNKEGDSLGIMMNRTLEGLKLEDPMFYGSLGRWKSLILSTVSKISILTGEDAEAVFQDILMALVQVRLVQEVPLYRWRGRLWEMSRVSGTLALLDAPRNNKKDTYRPTWAPVAEIEMVDRIKFDSMVYVKTQQTCANILINHYTQKNGYLKFSGEARLVKISSRRNGICYVNKVVPRLRRETKEVSMTGLLNVDNDFQDYDPVDLGAGDAEEELFVKETLKYIYFSSSEASRQVLSYLLAHPGASAIEIAREFHTDKIKVRGYFRSIRKTIHESLS